MRISFFDQKRDHNRDSDPPMADMTPLVDRSQGVIDVPDDVRSRGRTAEQLR